MLLLLLWWVGEQLHVFSLGHYLGYPSAPDPLLPGFVLQVLIVACPISGAVLGGQWAARRARGPRPPSR